jgi:hypothetical protein
VSATFDPLATLSAAGCPVDVLSDSQRAVLADLTQDETAVLITVHERFQATSDEVVAHELKLL